MHISSTAGKAGEAGQKAAGLTTGGGLDWFSPNTTTHLANCSGKATQSTSRLELHYEETFSSGILFAVRVVAKMLN